MDTPIPPVQIRLNPAGQGTVIVAGHDLSNYVSGLAVYADVGELNELNLTLRPTAALEVDAEARITVPEELREVLQLIGWTPPPGEAGPSPAGRLARTVEKALNNAVQSGLSMTAGPAEPDPYTGEEGRER